MARRRPDRPPPGRLAGVLGDLADVPPSPPEGGPHRYAWMYLCTWTSAAGEKIYAKPHQVETSSATNYQEASAIARREVLAGLTESEIALIALWIEPAFTCRRVGPILQID